MKKVLAILLASLLSLTLCACGNTTDTTDTSTTTTSPESTEARTPEISKTALGETVSSKTAPFCRRSYSRLQTAPPSTICI